MKCFLKIRYIKNTFSSISNPLLQNKSTFAPMILSYPVITTFQSNCKCHLSVQERASFVRSISLINLRFESSYNNHHNLNKMCFFSHTFSLSPHLIFAPIVATYCPPPTRLHTAEYSCRSENKATLRGLAHANSLRRAPGSGRPGSASTSRFMTKSRSVANLSGGRKFSTKEVFVSS